MKKIICLLFLIFTTKIFTKNIILVNKSGENIYWRYKRLFLSEKCLIRKFVNEIETRLSEEDQKIISSLNETKTHGEKQLLKNNEQINIKIEDFNDDEKLILYEKTYIKNYILKIYEKLIVGPDAIEIFSNEKDIDLTISLNNLKKNCLIICNFKDRLIYKQTNENNCCVIL